ncbi:hypothetical protein DY000_02020611 [Brassica cretica]|uniref:Uncharacterized protein n=1 Tax=Brassica cretica TaxID=69181 RepID=A0ABQ7E806_BRACR|nr:hypothetical protein DY000_02020611 [Brassica cretica]
MPPMQWMLNMLFTTLRLMISALVGPFGCLGGAVTSVFHMLRQLERLKRKNLPRLENLSLDTYLSKSTDKEVRQIRTSLQCIKCVSPNVTAVMRFGLHMLIKSEEPPASGDQPTPSNMGVEEKNRKHPHE